MMHKLHPYISKLIEYIEIKTEREIAFISVYLPGDSNLYSGLLEAVKVRLVDRDKPIAIFSFNSKEFLKKQDRFNILSLKGTSFVRLPFKKQEFEDIIGKKDSIPDDEWERFSENACKTLLLEQIINITHRGSFNIGSVLNPLWSVCSMTMNPELGEVYSRQLPRQFEAVRNYITIPEVKNFLHYCLICQNSKDTYLQFAFNFAIQLQKLAECKDEANAAMIISLIDSIRNSFDNLRP